MFVIRRFLNPGYVLENYPLKQIKLIFNLYKYF